MSNSNAETNMQATADNLKHSQEHLRAINLHFISIILSVKSIHSHYKLHIATGICINHFYKMSTKKIDKLVSSSLYICQFH